MSHLVAQEASQHVDALRDMLATSLAEDAPGPQRIPRVVHYVVGVLFGCWGPYSRVWSFGGAGPKFES